MEPGRLLIFFAILGALLASLLAVYLIRRRNESQELKSDRRDRERRSFGIERREQSDRRSPKRRIHDEAHNLERRDGERRLGARRDSPDWIDQYKTLRSKVETTDPAEEKKES